MIDRERERERVRERETFVVTKTRRILACVFVSCIDDCNQDVTGESFHSDLMRRNSLGGGGGGPGGEGPVSGGSAPSSLEVIAPAATKTIQVGVCLSNKGNCEPRQWHL